MDVDIDMKQAGEQAAHQPGQEEPEDLWSPFPVSSEQYDDMIAPKLVLRFPIRASLDQCLESLRAASARMLGPYAGPFGELLDGLERSADVVADYESRYCGDGGGRYYTEDGADCAAYVLDDDVAPLVRYLMDMVLLMDAGCAFGQEEV
ncbi:hypothetical protein [uncultured Alistipes sp.]|jgi:hypothetical protein|uniref:hypothetical protein n=1 Tax=uncultured Alistipes sp. TaxID=538949 RepID=UPI00272CE5E3|nr:hypothetical protein [uncultured Alistipes sp.]